QKYVASTTPDGRAYDIRVPLLRAAGGKWQVARIYVRQGEGHITSNLATGGSSYDAGEFLAGLYGRTLADALVQQLEQASRHIAEVLQKHYPFLIDALGCDFGIADGKPYLFEVNPYPGIKGCLEAATDLKVEYYAGLSAAWRQARLETGANLLQRFDWLHALEQVFDKQTGHSATAPEVEAATPANQALLRKVMAQGENDFSRSPFL